MENENNVKNNVQTTPVDQAVVNNAPAQPQATNVVENNVVKENHEESNNNSKKILTAFLMLIVTAISLTTASYAWFTENTTVTVDSIDVNVSAANGIQVSVDAVNWKENISTNDITANAYAGNTNQLPNQIVPVSTIGDVDATTGFMKMYKGSIEADATTAHGYRLVAEQSIEKAGTTGDFIAFDLFLLTTQATTVYLTTSSDVVATAADTGLKNAARVAFLYEGSAATGASADAIALKGAASHSAGGATNMFWEPNSNIHTAAGVAQANNYGETIYDATTVVPNYYGIKAAIAANPAVDYQSKVTTYFDQVTPDIQTPNGNTANGEYKTLFNLAAGINKVRIYGWVEGQDYDCENNASGSNITFNIQISKNAGA